MVKVLIYSSKEIYEKSSFEGRAEANIIAYRDGLCYVVLKNRTTQYIPSNDRIPTFTLSRIIKWAERDEWDIDMKSHKLKESYRNHPITILMKNETADV